MSSSSSSSEAEWPFQVFLNFRGEDVRHGFVAHLHKALLHGGINAYIDSVDLRAGDEISPALTKAIEESRIAVLVFSENYASSRWCLDELVKVMECKRLKGQQVLPVFYRVDPSEIRGQRESYGEALTRHEVRLGKGSEKVEKWRQALTEAANLSGCHHVNGDEAKFIENIVKKISTMVGRIPLSVAKYPVGVRCRVDEVKSLLSTGSDDVQMIGIWGTGGIGKTTVAKAVYNSIASQFDGYSYLANVRETSSKPDGLVDLQKTLLSEILGKENVVVFSVDGGVNLIRDRLCCKKILLLLDDVDHGDQLNALAGEREWFGKGSKIIITTRDKRLLTSHGIDQVYEVKPLDGGEAFELLSSYAFPRSQTKDISRDLIDNILGYANGLPLAIVVLGPFLCGRSREEWESTWKKLAESPIKDINSVLKISLDALEDNEKDIFLDIDWLKLGKFHCQRNCQVVLPGGEMPKWLLPNKEGYISFMASKDLYKRILGVAFCVVFQIDGESLFSFDLRASINCKGTKHTRWVNPCDLEHVWLEYMESKELWTVDDFGPNDSSHFHVSIGASSPLHYTQRIFVKNCGFLLICKPLENDMKVLLQEDQLLNPALLYEVLHEDNPTSMEEESSSEAKDLQESETYTEEEGLNMADFSIEKHRYSQIPLPYRNVRPGREMPNEFVLVEDGTISFMASQDLYCMLRELVLCVVFGVEDGTREISFDIVPHVHGQRRNGLSGTLGSFDSDHMWFQYLRPNVLWGVLQGSIDFGQFEESYLRFSLTVRVLGGTVKKLGYMIGCWPLKNDLKVELEDKQLMDPASLYESDAHDIRVKYGN